MSSVAVAFKFRSFGAQKIASQLKSLEAQTRRVGNAWGAMYQVMAGAGIARGIGDLVGSATKLKTITSTLNVANRDAGDQAAETADDLSFLREEADRLGVSLPGSASQFAKLAAAANGTSLAGREVENVFIALGEASTALTLDHQSHGRALNALQQMVSKGKVSMEELRQQLGEHIPGAFEMAARGMGLTQTELNRLVERGEVTAEQLLPALSREMHKTFGPQAAEMAKTYTAQFGRLNNAFFEGKVLVGEEFAPALGDLAEKLALIGQDQSFRQMLVGLGKSMAAIINFLTSLVSKYHQIRAVAAEAMGTIIDITVGAAETTIDWGITFVQVIDTIIEKASDLLQGPLGKIVDPFGRQREILRQAESDAEAVIGILEDLRESFRANIVEPADEISQALFDVAAEQRQLSLEAREYTEDTDRWVEGNDARARSLEGLNDLLDKATKRLRKGRGGRSIYDDWLRDIEHIGDGFQNPAFTEFVELMEERRELLESIANDEERAALWLAESHRLAKRLDLSEAQRQRWLEKQLETLEEQTSFAKQLEENFQRLATDQLSELFTGLLPQAEGVFGEIFNAFARMVAEMVAAAAASKLTEALFSGGSFSLKGLGSQIGGLFGIGGNAGGAAAGAAAASAAPSTPAAGLSASAMLALVPAAVFAVGSYFSDRRADRVFSQAAGASFYNGQINFSATDSGTQSDALTQRLQELMDGVMGVLGDSVESLGSISVLARRDGGAFQAYVEGELVGTFQDAERALQQAVVRAFSSGTVDSPQVQRALEASASSTVEQLTRNIETALRLQNQGLSPEVVELSSTIQQQIDDAWRFIKEDLGLAGFGPLEGQGFLSGSIQSAFDDFLGVQRDDTLDRLGILNQARDDMYARIEREIQSTLDLMARVGDSSVQIAVGARGFTGRLDQAAELVSGTLDIATRTIGSSLNISAQELQERLEFYRRELELLPDRLTEEDVRQSQTRGSGRSQRRQRREALGERISGILDSVAGSTTSTIRTLVRDITGLREEAESLGGGFGRLGEAIGVLSNRIKDEFEQRFRQAFAAAGLTAALALPAMSPALGVTYAQLNEQLTAVEQETNDWRASLEELAALGDKDLIDPAALEAATEARFSALGEEVIGSLGLPLESTRRRLGAIAGTVRFLRDNQERLNISAERFEEITRQLADQSFSSIGGGLLDLIDDEERFGHVRQDIQRRLFEADIAQRRLEFEMAVAQGVFTREEVQTLRELFAHLDRNIDEIFDRVTDSTEAVESSLSSISSISSSIESDWDPYADAQAFLDELDRLQFDATQSPLEQIALQMQTLRDRAVEVGTGFHGLGTNLGEVWERIDQIEQMQIDQVFRNALAPLLSLRDELTFGGLSSLDPRTQLEQQAAQVMDLFDAAQNAQDPEDQLAAIQELGQLLPQLMQTAPDLLSPEALASMSELFAGNITALEDAFGDSPDLAAALEDLGALQGPDHQEQMVASLGNIDTRLEETNRRLESLELALVDRQIDAANQGADRDLYLRKIAESTTRTADHTRNRQPPVTR